MPETEVELPDCARAALESARKSKAKMAAWADFLYEDNMESSKEWGGNAVEEVVESWPGSVLETQLLKPKELADSSGLEALRNDNSLGFFNNLPKILRKPLPTKSSVVKTVVGSASIDFLGGGRRTNAEGKRYPALLGGNRIEHRGRGENVFYLRQGGDGFGRSGMGGDADGTFGCVGRARVVVRSQGCGGPDGQQQAEKCYLFRDRTHAEVSLARKG